MVESPFKMKKLLRNVECKASVQRTEPPVIGQCAELRWLPANQWSVLPTVARLVVVVVEFLADRWLCDFLSPRGRYVQKA